MFRSISPNIDESPQLGESPATLARRLATAKATEVALNNPDSIVIGSDQTGECNKQLLRKPKTLNCALEMLLSYQQQTVCFYSAVVVLSPQQNRRSDVITTEVQFRDFSVEEATQYLKIEEPLDCVGAFKSESRGPLLFKSVCSEDPTALIGLPLIRTVEFLRELGINPLHVEKCSNDPQNKKV